MTAPVDLSCPHGGGVACGSYTCRKMVVELRELRAKLARLQAERDEVDLDYELAKHATTRAALEKAQAEVGALREALTQAKAAIVGALQRFGIADVAAIKGDGYAMVNYVELGRAIGDLDEALTREDRAALARGGV